MSVNHKIKKVWNKNHVILIVIKISDLNQADLNWPTLASVLGLILIPALTWYASMQRKSKYSQFRRLQI